MERKVYRFPFRHTRLGGFTKVVAICPICRKVLEPTKVYRSRTGNHGEDIYVHEHQILAIYLEQSNSGKRRIDVPAELQSIKDLLEMSWIYTDSEVDDVITVLKAYLVSQSLK